MNVIEKILKRFGYSKSTRESIAMNDLLKFLGVDDKQDEKLLAESTYFACHKVLSESVGKLPLKLLRHNDKHGVETMRDHPLFRILHDRPNPYMTASTFWSTVEFNRNHYGNAYVWIQGAGKNMKLWILPTPDVEVWIDDARILADQPDIYYQYTGGGKTYMFGSEEILHFKSFNTEDGIVGISVRDQLRSTITGSLKSQKLLNRMYDSGFTAKAVLNYTGNLNDANVKALIKNVEAYAKGELAEEGIENIIPMPIGFSLNPLSVKLGDNQFIEVKQYTALQIASAFGIKPYQIGDYTKSSYASAEAQQLSFYVDTLLYIIKQYEEELTYKLLTDEEIAKGYHFKFNVGVILRADLKTQVETLVKAINGGLYKANEARALMDLESVEGGDTLLVNGTSIPINMIGVQYVNQPEDPPEDNNPENDPDNS